MNTVNKDMRDAEKNLAGLEKCCGLCSCPWQKVQIELLVTMEHNNLFMFQIQGKAPPKDEEYKKIWKKNQDGKVVNSQPMNVADDRNAVNIVNIALPRFYPLKNQVTIGGPMIKRVTDDAREDEMEENLGQVRVIGDTHTGRYINFGHGNVNFFFFLVSGLFMHQQSEAYGVRHE